MDASQSSAPLRTSVYPEIVAHEFEDFASLMKDPAFPQTYEGWIDRVGYEISDRMWRGSLIDPRKVHAIEFSRWCEVFAVRPSYVALWRFAAWKSELRRP